MEWVARWDMEVVWATEAWVDRWATEAWVDRWATVEWVAEWALVWVVEWEEWVEDLATWQLWPC